MIGVVFPLVFAMFVANDATNTDYPSLAVQTVGAFIEAGINELPGRPLTPEEQIEIFGKSGNKEVRH